MIPIIIQGIDRDEEATEDGDEKASIHRQLYLWYSR